MVINSNRMKFKSILFLFLFSSVFVFSQNRTIDSLTLVLSQVKNDQEKATILNAIADQYKTSNPNLMLEFANKALPLSQKNNNKIEEGKAYLNRGNANIILGNYAVSFSNFNKAQTIFENLKPENGNEIEIKNGLAKALGSIGIIYSEQSNYSKALTYYLKSVKLYETLNEEAKCAKLYNNIGIVYKSQKNHQKALQYFEKAVKIQTKLKDSNSGITQTNIANTFVFQKNFDKALEFYQLAKQSLDQYPDDRALGEWYNNYGLYHKLTNNPEKAIENWNLAIATFEKIDDKFGVADTYLLVGQLDLEQNNSASAIENATKSLQLANELQILEQKMLAEKLLSEAYSKQGNTKEALRHFKLYSVFKDSLINEENIRKSVETSLNYEFEKKELLQKETNEKQALLSKEEAKISKYKVVFGSLIALLVFGIGFLIYSRSQLKKNLTLEKELAEYEQKALHLQMNPHFIFNCLGSISSFIVNNSTESAIKYLAKFSKLMRLTLEYSKESLIPVDKEIESLQNYLELEQLRFNQKFEFTITKDVEVEDDIGIPPLLLQPLVENAIIHGIVPKKEVGLIAIHFYIENNQLLCSISDNGIGITASKAIKENSVSVHKSMAIDIIRQRLEKIASTTAKIASMKVEEIKENSQVMGTKVMLSLPIQFIAHLEIKN